MERTAEEIKKGLECCRESQDCTQDNMPKCPYYEKETCLIELADDALALIQQLQAENAEKDQRIRMLERSRSFAADLADGLKAATVKQEQEIYVLVERNRQLEAQNAELLEKVEQLQAKWDAAMDVLRGQKCDTCEYRDIDTREEPCIFCMDGNRWQWIGIQKKEE